MMNILRRVTTIALTTAALTGSAAYAKGSEVELEWQRPGYVTEVVVVTARRLHQPVEVDSEVGATDTTADAVTLAWQEPGYVQEVVIVTASRDDVLAAKARAEGRARAIELAMADEQPGRSRHWLGTSSR